MRKRNTVCEELLAHMIPEIEQLKNVWVPF